MSHTDLEKAARLAISVVRYVVPKLGIGEVESHALNLMPEALLFLKQAKEEIKSDA